jgi:hypothetical protein
MSAAALLLALHRAGASVRADAGQVVVRAPPNVLSPDLVSELRDRRRLCSPY